MYYLIDARFEQFQPELSVINTQNNKIVLKIDAEALNRLVEAGTIYPPDFLCACNIQSIVKDLFLLACSQTLHIEKAADICLHCEQCSPDNNFSLHKLN